MKPHPIIAITETTQATHARAPYRAWVRVRRGFKLAAVYTFDPKPGLHVRLHDANVRLEQSQDGWWAPVRGYTSARTQVEITIHPWRRWA